MTEGRLLHILKDNYLLLLIVLLGLGLRIYDLGGESIWFDEAMSIRVGWLGFAEQIKWIAGQGKEANPPFYYMLLHLWIPVFGDSEFVSRLPSAVFGVLSIIFTYSIGKLLFGKRAGLFAALIIAVSIFHVRYSQEARGYALMVFLALVSCYSLLRLIPVWSRRWAAVYILSSALLCYTHYFGLFIVLAQNIFCFTIFLRRGRAGALGLSGWVVIQLILGIISLPDFVLLVKKTMSVKESFWLVAPGYRDLIHYFTIYAGSRFMLVLLAGFALLAILNPERLRRLKGLGALLAPADESAAVREITYGEKIYFLLLWIAVPLIVPFVISLTFTPIMVSRYTIAASTGFYLLAAAGMGALDKKIALYAVAAAIIVLPTPKLYRYYDGVDKHQWREVINEIESNAGSGDYILVFPFYDTITPGYYLERDDLRVIPLRDEVPSYPDMQTHDVWFVMHTRSPSKLNTKVGPPEFDIISESKYYELNLFRLRKR